MADQEHRGIAISCQACGPELGEELVTRLGAAARALELAAHVGEIVLCVDDLPADDAGWLRLDPVPGCARPRLTLYCGRLALADGAATLAAGDEPFAWEAMVPTAESAPAAADAAATAAFLHHQLLLAHDLLTGRLDPDDIPAALAETFAAAWDVALDGRLSRRGLPGYALEARRAQFSRLVSSASVLMPHHWQIFQSLWDGGLVRQGEVLAAVRQLPRL